MKENQLSWPWWLKLVILDNLGGIDQENHSSRSAWAKKFMRPHLNQWWGMVAYACHPKRIVVQVGQGIN
jgi:hypothetical protein